MSLESFGPESQASLKYFPLSSIGVGDMSKNSYRDIFHCPDDIDIISRYVNKLQMLP